MSLESVSRKSLDPCRLGAPRLCSGVSRQHWPHRMLQVPCDLELLPVSVVSTERFPGSKHCPLADTRLGI